MFRTRIVRLMAALSLAEAWSQRLRSLTADYAGTSAADRTALQAMVDSIQIQH